MKIRQCSFFVLLVIISLSLPIASLSSPAKAQADWLQVWTKRARNEYVSWIIEYRDASGNVLASYDVPSYPSFEPHHVAAGRVVDHGLEAIHALDPYTGGMTTLPAPGFPDDRGNDWYMITQMAVSPDGARYAYNVNRQASDYEQGADSWIYVGTVGADDAQLVLEENTESSYAIEPLALSADGQRLLVRHMPQGIGGYILFMSHRETRILDMATGDFQFVGEIDGYSANFEYVGLIATDDIGTALIVTETATGGLARYPLPDLGEPINYGGGVTFSPNNSLIAYQMARHDPDNETFWTIVVERETGETRVVLIDHGANFQMQYGYIGGWLDNTTLVVGDIWNEHAAIVDVTSGALLREDDYVFVGYAIGITDTTGFAPPQIVAPPCPDAPPLRLRILQRGRITFTDGALTNVRDAPGVSGEKIAALPEGSQFTVLDGPICNDGYAWWQLAFDDGVTGFVAEGVQDAYFLELWE